MSCYGDMIEERKSIFLINLPIFYSFFQKLFTNFLQPRYPREKCTCNKIFRKHVTRSLNWIPWIQFKLDSLNWIFLVSDETLHIL